MPRKVVGIIVLLIVIFIPTVPGRAESRNTLLLTAATAHQTNDVEAVVLAEFKRRVEERTKGYIRVQLSTDGLLGNDEQLIKGLQQGAVDLITCASFKYADYIPEFIVLDLPFLFFSTEHLSANLNGELGQILTTKAQESRGEHVLGYITDGPVNIVSDRALVYISQGKKLHFRTMLLPTHRQTWAKLGITPVTLASSEIKIGVEVGMVDAIETNYLDYKELRLYGTARFILQSEHYFPLSLLLLSKSAWYRIPASYRELVRQCAFDAIQYGSMKLIQQNKEVARELTGKYGVKITELNLAEKKTNRQKLLTYQEDLFNAHGLAKAWSELSKSYVEYETALAEELERIIQNQGE